jgi:putative spermidine/putrescine transport system substrate-binding protein
MEVLHSDEGQLAWLKGHAHPVHLDDMLARGVVPADILAALPTLTASAPSPAQLTAARDAIKTGWDTTVGVEVK